MELSSRIKLGVYASMCILAISLPSIYFEFLSVSEARDNFNLADIIQESILTRSLIRDEYLLYYEDAAKNEYTKIKEADDERLQKAMAQFDSVEMKRIVEDLISVLHDISNLFYRIVDTASAQGIGTERDEVYIEAGKRLVSQILLKNSEAQRLTAKLVELSRVQLERAYRVAVLTTFVFILVIAMFTFSNSRSIFVLLIRRKQAEDALQSAYDYLESQVNERTIELKYANEELRAEAYERQQAEETLLQKNFRLTRTEAMAKIGSWEWDVATDTVKWSDELFHIFGLDQAQGAPTFSQQRSLYPPEDWARLQSGVETSMHDGIPFELELRFQRTGGTIMHCLCLGFLEAGTLGDNPRMYGLIQDITERKRNEEEFRKIDQKNAELNDILITSQQIASIGSWTWEIEANIVWWSDETYRIFGVTPDEYTPNFETNAQFIHPDDLPTYKLRFEHSLETGEPLSFDLRVVLKNGAMKYCTAQGKVIYNESGALQKFIGTVLDITARKQAEKIAQDAMLQAESANKSKSEFLANMSHEIRTPMNGILGMLQLLETTSLEDEQKEYVVAAVKSTNRLTRLLSDILDLSRMEAGKLVLDEVEFEVKNQKESVMEVFIVASRPKGIALDFFIDERIPPKLIGDKARLRQVLFNLVGNAIKFTDEGFVRVEASPLLIPSSGSCCRVLFTVIDTGIGIPDDRLKDIFDPFVQVEGSYVRTHQGAGLGLSIVRKLVKLMDGDLTIDSTDGGGTTVYLSLPFKLPVGQKVVSEQRAHTGTSDAVKHLKILFAEDDSVSSLTCKRLLEKSGFSVITAKDGQEALQQLSTQDFDLILMDIQMPVMDGVEATRAIRGSSTLGLKSSIPIIAMTAYAMTGDKEKFIDAGMNDYISKPVDKEALLEVIEKVMAKAASSN